eukprot:SAG31_NODE_13632_length_856_cov_1.327609_1_plen_98_part_00
MEVATRALGIRVSYPSQETNKALNSTALLAAARVERWENWILEIVKSSSPVKLNWLFYRISYCAGKIGNWKSSNPLNWIRILKKYFSGFGRFSGSGF